MPIIALQRRHHQIGRIRIGVQVPVNGTTKSGKPRTRPVKLETFRLTSSDRRAIDAAAALYGGDPHPWEEQEGQFEVITDTNELSIAIPPDGELSQWYEQWSGGGCTRRCDGQWEQIGDQACVCDPDARECSPHTRLSVVLTDLPGMGMWRLDTQGWYAATELAGTINLLAAAADRGTFLPARLRLEQRQVKRPGQALRKFAVPVVDLDVPLLQVPALISGSARAALGPSSAVAVAPDPETGELPGPAARAGLTPVPDTLMGPTVADQVRAAEEPKSRSRESTPKLPATGRRPRPVDEAGEGDVPFRPGDQTAPPGGDAEEGGPTMPFPQFFAMRCREVLGGETVDVADRRRHDLIAAVTAGEKTSGRDLTLEEQHQALAWLDMIKDGTAVLEHDENHRWVVRACDEQDGPCPDSLFAELDAVVNGLTDEQRTKQLGPWVQNRVVRMRTQAGDRNPRFSHRHHMRTCDALEALGLDQPAAEPVAEPEPVENGEPF